MYITRGCWDFGLSSSSNTEEHGVSETGSVSILDWKVGDVRKSYNYTRSSDLVLSGGGNRKNLH
jgi:hypothetical protein